MISGHISHRILNFFCIHFAYFNLFNLGNYFIQKLLRKILTFILFLSIGCWPILLSEFIDNNRSRNSNRQTTGLIVFFVKTMSSPLVCDFIL